MWPDELIIRLYVELFVLVLTDEAARPTAMVSLFILLVIPLKLFEWTLYQGWQRKIFLQEKENVGIGKNELGRVAWVVGHPSGIFQSIWKKHGNYCKQNPSYYAFGYVLSLCMLFGGVILLSMDFWAFILLLLFEFEPTWIIEVKYNTGYYANNRPFLISLAVGLAGRFWICFGLLTAFKTWVLKGFMGSYSPYPGIPKDSLEKINPDDSNDLPIGYEGVNQLSGIKYYVRPTGTFLQYMFNPQVWVFEDEPDNTTPWIHTGASHGEIKYDQKTGMQYMIPNNEILESQNTWLEEASAELNNELVDAQRNVSLAVRTSAEDKRKQIYDREISIIPNTYKDVKQ